MFKLLLLVLLLAFACAAAMMLIHRLNRISAQLGLLRSEAERKEDELNRRVATINAQAKAQAKAQAQVERQAERDEDGRTRIEN